MHLDDGSFHNKIQRVPDHLSGKREGLEVFLVHEVEAASITVEVGCLDYIEVRLFESLAGFEGLVEDGAGKKVAHLQADQGLAASSGGGGNVRFQAHVGSVFELEKHFTFYVDSIDECGHDFLRDKPAAEILLSG